MISFPFIKSFVFVLSATVLLALFAASIPVGGMFLVPLVPQPALAFGLRHGLARGAALVALATALATYLGGADVGAGYSFLAVMVMLLLFSFGRDWPIERVVALAAGGMFAALAVVLGLAFGSFAAVQEAVGEGLREHMETSLDLYAGMGFSPDSMELLRERAPEIVAMFLRILPALAFAGFVGVILINLLFLLRRFPERRGFIAATADFREWRSPEFLVWCFILAGFGLFLPGAEAARTVGLNVFLMIAVFYFFQGLSIVAYYFHHKHVPYFLRSLIYLVIVVEQICTVLVVALGLFDLWGDFRRLKKKGLSPGEVS